MSDATQDAQPTSADTPQPEKHNAKRNQWQGFIKPVEIIGLVLALVAIIFAWWHERDLRETTTKLKDIQQSISTQPIGSFPDFVDKIEATVRRANRRVIVACDFPAYGEFDGKGLPIQHAIQDKIHDGKEVSLTFLGPDRRHAARRAQFPESDWLSTMQSDSERRRMLTFLKNHRYTKPSAPRYNDFIETLDAYDIDMLHHEYQAADTTEVNTDMPLFFWIADDSEAVMVVQTSGGHEDSAFFTKDLRLIMALKSIASDYRQTALPSAAAIRHVN